MIVVAIVARGKAFGVGAAEEVFGKLGKLAGAKQRFAVDDEGRQDFGIGLLARVQVEHEADQRALQLRAIAPVNGEAGSGDFGGPFQVEDAELRAQLPVRLRLEVERPHLAPLLHFHVAALVGSNRDFIAREIRDAREDGPHLLFGLTGTGFELIDARFKGASFVHHGGRILAGLLQPRDLFTQLVTLGLELLGLRDALAAQLIQLAKVTQQGGRILSSIAELLLYGFKVGTNKSQVEHA